MLEQLLLRKTAREGGGEVAVGAASSQEETKALARFDGHHLDSVRLDENNFNDYSGSMNFTGRVGFSKSLAGGIQTIVSRMKKKKAGALFLDRGTAFVYSTVSGSGKARSMVELKN